MTQAVTDTGRALAVLAVWMLVLLTPLHQTAALSAFGAPALVCTGTDDSGPTGTPDCPSCAMAKSLAPPPLATLPVARVTPDRRMARQAPPFPLRARARRQRRQPRGPPVPVRRFPTHLSQTGYQTCSVPF